MIHSIHLLFLVGLLNYFFSQNDGLWDLMLRFSSLFILMFFGYFLSVLCVFILNSIFGNFIKLDKEELYYSLFKSAVIYFPFVFIPFTYTYPAILFGKLNNMLIYAITILLVGMIIFNLKSK